MKRRDFIKRVAPMSLLPFAIQGQPINAYGSILGAKAQDFVDTDNVLVLVQLNGGNDGLNTVIPLDQYANLTAARPDVIIPENKVLSMTGTSDTGLHPSLGKLRNMYNDGKVRIVQNVGYPNQNYSHFRSTDIWLTASDRDEVLESGWIGRYLSEEWPNYPNGFPNDDMKDPLAIQIGSVVSPVCQGLEVNMGFAIANPTNFYQLLTGDYGATPDNWAGHELEYIRTTAHQSNEYAQRVKTVYEASSNISNEYPTDFTNYSASLTNQLKIVARLINGGLKTRVYIVRLGGFDTHANQVDPTSSNDVGSHANLMANLSDSIHGFQDDITKMGKADRVLGMTFSEFGRRIVSNASTGTDHGAAAPLFMFGNAVKGGITGDNPTIPSGATVRDNLPMEHDFRTIYSSILEKWFCLDAQTTDSVMLQEFDRLDVLEDSCTTSSITRNQRAKAGDAYIMNYPNPFSSYTTVKFYSNGGHVNIDIMNQEGKRIKTLVNATIPEGEHEVNFDTFGLAAGTYYCRYQNEQLTHTRSMLKV
ncbi:MAG: DUF1501 domain-containing protein [Bacteroidia bacterium]